MDNIFDYVMCAVFAILFACSLIACSISGDEKKPEVRVSEYQFRCEQVNDSGFKGSYRCVNKETVCYLFSTGVSCPGPKDAP